MFTRTARMFGFALALFFVTAGLTSLSVSAQPDKKGEKKDEKKDSKKVKSKIKITVPQDDAKLKIEDKDTKPTGVTREFETPELDSGKLYEYTFSVTWQPNNYTTLTRTKSIEFKGGDDIVADLTKADPKAPDKAVIRWVPTPDDIVDEMLKLGKVGKDDVVYEPGPGDGRMLIAAVKKGAKKGVGIELDPKKADEAKDAVKKAKLEKEITIIEGDALKDRDYSEATVVLLYMGNEFNNLLRPVLEKQLKPGARIVSHRFVIGDWAPDKTIKVTGADGEEYTLHVWTVKEKK
ncbi:TIGR03000 domain-containing protein [Gemmata sp. G18]|uniref:TIGR03000 domain-containing protein n=1 Tax=Gemmata palustris TaxID=2822762 RepID=A0ABS5C050_9BACT|nr:TIGR03000 domain-containing protein [Gemmata palustris]MBP3959363.1 TIGR03000 domain-containing protein [Gemmata palustris]